MLTIKASCILLCRLSCCHFRRISICVWLYLCPYCSAVHTEWDSKDAESKKFHRTKVRAGSLEQKGDVTLKEACNTWSVTVYRTPTSTGYTSIDDTDHGQHPTHSNCKDWCTATHEKCLRRYKPHVSEHPQNEMGVHACPFKREVSLEEIPNLSSSDRREKEWVILSLKRNYQKCQQPHRTTLHWVVPYRSSLFRDILRQSLKIIVGRKMDKWVRKAHLRSTWATASYNSSFRSFDRML